MQARTWDLLTPCRRNEVIDADTLMPQGSGAFSAVSTVIDNPEDSANYAIGRYIVENLPDLGFESDGRKDCRRH